MTRIDRLTIVVPGRDPAQAERLAREFAARLATELPHTGVHRAHVRVASSEPGAVRRQLDAGGHR